MVKIQITNGLNIPIEGRAKEEFKPSQLSLSIAADFSPFTKTLRMKPNVKVGDKVAIGDPLAYDPRHPERVYLSNAGGTISAIERGEKRRLLSIKITRDEAESTSPYKSVKDPFQEIFTSGLSFHFFARPFHLPICPTKKPRAIFISAIDSSPLACPAHFHLLGHEEAFQTGLSILSQIAPCHLVSQEDVFLSFAGVAHHRALGPHPVGDHSVHIEAISPIRGIEDCLWTTSIHGVIAVGMLLGEGKHLLTRTIALTGNGIRKEERRLTNVRWGSEIAPLIETKTSETLDRILSGDPLHGKHGQSHLGFFDLQICGLPSPPPPRVMPFAGLGLHFFTAHKTYLSSLFRSKQFPFSSRLMGAQRPMINGALYQKVMPLSIRVEALIEALLAKDYEAALSLGLLDVAAHDFSLCEFICPSKIPFTSIVEKAIEDYLELYSGT